MIITRKHLPRRTFLRGLGAAIALPMLDAMQPALARAGTAKSPVRLAFTYVPNGVTLADWTPEGAGRSFAFTRILKPLEAFKDRTLVLKGVCDRVRGDGDNHMRGIGCLLTGIELFPGNIQGGSDTPAGWASGRIGCGWS